MSMPPVDAAGGWGESMLIDPEPDDAAQMVSGGDEECWADQVMSTDWLAASFGDEAAGGMEAPGGEDTLSSFMLL